MYPIMFVMYAEIVDVQCYRRWYVETGYINTTIWEIINSKIRHSYKASAT